MAMNKKEYERMEFYRESATKYEQDLRNKENKTQEFKSYLNVRSKLLSENSSENKVIQELLQYINNYLI